jgi:hypothetical protein
MTAQKGKDLLLKLDSDGAGSFVTVAGLRARTLAFIDRRRTWPGDTERQARSPKVGVTSEDETVAAIADKALRR